MKPAPGARFTYLTVIEFTHVTRSGKIWKCQCDCGNKTFASSGALTAGQKTSCGCKRREWLRRFKKKSWRPTEAPKATDVDDALEELGAYG